MKLLLINIPSFLFSMEYCHQHGICHRDLKPENLLLTSDRKVIIADFGLSTSFFNQMGCQVVNTCNASQLDIPFGKLNLKSVVGTPHYVAPEVLKNSDGYDGAKADVWSLGCILFAMLNGSLPFAKVCIYIRRSFFSCAPNECTANIRIIYLYV